MPTGWKNFTDRILEILNEKQEPVVFLLWGNHAQAKSAKITNTRHLVLKSAHPSGLSASKGFYGNGHFAKTNEFFVKQGLSFDWSL